MHSETIFPWIVVIACAFQLVGTVLMANALFKARENYGGLLLSALVRGKKARDWFDVSGERSKENKVKSLQGLCILGLGFFLDLVCKIHELLSSLGIPSSTPPPVAGVV